MTKQVMISLPQALMDKLERLAAAMDRSRNDVVNELVRLAYVDTHSQGGQD